MRTATLRSTRWLLLVALPACGGASAPSTGGGEGPPAAATAAVAAPAPGGDAPLRAALPELPGPFAPGEMRVGRGRVEGATLADVNECETCHTDVAAQWRTSAHAFASFNNPVYRAIVDRFRDDAGHPKSRFCSSCHDVALLADGAVDRDVDPGDARAHAGITCRTCHSIRTPRPDGNGSYTLTAEPIPIPTEGDAASVAAHIARAAPLRGAALCATCHRAFLGEETGNASHLAGTDDVTPWQRSVYAGSDVHRLDDAVPAADCAGCHMPPEPAVRNDAAAKEGRIKSHRFLGGHTWLAAMRGDEDSARRVAEMLRGAASIDIAAVVHASGERTLPADGAPMAAGERVVFDVAIRNTRVGHRFPGGTLDLQDTWVEIDVRDASGAVLAEAGGEHEATGADPTAHRLRALMVGEDGRPLLEHETNRFRAGVFNHTVPPRDVAVVEYAFLVPEGLSASALPLRVEARLRHRTRSLEVQRAACAASRAARGRAFRALRPASDLDACTPQPVTTVASTWVWVGEGAASRPADGARPPTWRRLYEHGLGLQRALQERRGEALPSLERALSALSGQADASAPRARAMVMAALGSLSARQGRADEALTWLDRAAALAPDHPAPFGLRGEALMAVWRFGEALAPLARAAAAASGDDTAWSALAVARGSTGDARGALAAAHRGLAMKPRDQDLLRVQALSLRALSAPEGEAEAAQRAYLTYRSADDTPDVRSRCSKSVPGCANERNPVHVHEMRPAR